MCGNTLAMPLLLVSTLTIGVLRVWLASGLNSCRSQDDHTPSGPTLGGSNTDSTIAGNLIRRECRKAGHYHDIILPKPV